MNELNSYLTIEFFGTVIKVILSVFTLIYSLVILRDVLDLQTFYESRFNVLFKILSFLTVIGSLILLLTSFNK
jgi:hypothetical protein